MKIMNKNNSGSLHGNSNIKLKKKSGTNPDIDKACLLSRYLINKVPKIGFIAHFKISNTKIKTIRELFCF